MSSRSSSPAEPLASGKRKKSSSKSVPRNEGTDSSWPFVVPAGYTLSEANPDEEVDENFDWDNLRNNPNLELWLIRVPHNLSVKHLDSVPFSPSTSRQPEKIGELIRKQTSYDIWSCAPSRSGDVGRADGDMSIGEEMNSITCLLPRKAKKNTLYAAPKPISRHVVITAQPAQAQHAPDAEGKPATILQNPPRQSHPPELLKHRFLPYGSLAPGGSVKEDEEGHDHRHKTKSRKKADITDAPQISEASEAVSNIGMDVEITPQDSPKKNTKDRKSKRGTTATEPVQEPASSPSTIETTKKRKGTEEAAQGMVEGKKRKKLKTKAA